MSKLRNPSKKYDVLAVAQYFSHLGLTKKLIYYQQKKGCLIKIPEDIDTSKTAGIGRLPGRFMNGSGNVLARPVTDICNFSVSLNKVPSAFKLAKDFQKMDERLMSQITDLSLYCQYFQRSLKKLFTNSQLSF